MRSNCSFRILSAKQCDAERLATVYPQAEREKQLLRLHSFITDPAAGRRFFVIAREKEKTCALLHLCREKKYSSSFRVRGLYTHPDFRHRGLATHLLRLGCKAISEFYQAQAVLSFILPTNISSLVVHKRALFSPYRGGSKRAERHLMFVWERAIF